MTTARVQPFLPSPRSAPVDSGPAATAPRPAAPAPVAPAPASAGSALWLHRYVRVLVFVDLFAVLLAGVAALFLRFGQEPGAVRGVSYIAIACASPIAWLAVLGLSRCYEPRFLGTGPQEFQRVGNAAVRLTAVVALFAYATQVEVARGFVALALPLGGVLLLLGRYGARLALHHYRRAGRCGHRVLVLGARRDVRELAVRLRREPLSGLQVVGACVPGGQGEVAVPGGEPVPVLGALPDVHAALLATGADTVAVTASPGLQGEWLTRLSYELEGTGVDLIVAPALTNVIGSRISIRPVAGLPLLHLDEPELSGARTLMKGAFDRVAALLGLVVLALPLLAVAVAVRATSPGPALFRQTRVGRGGTTFTLWKFRTMHVDAEAQLAGLLDRNEHDGVLFKLRGDPRVTRLGKTLRAYSLDELPQLVNVLRGHMSLVGPRPPLPSEVERYVGHTRRRLLVKPGLTGLWQVSGRSDLSWEDTVRLDLHYVENWSLGLDLSLLARTVHTVVTRRGAY